MPPPGAARAALRPAPPARRGGRGRPGPGRARADAGAAARRPRPGAGPAGVLRARGLPARSCGTTGAGGDDATPCSTASRACFPRRTEPDGLLLDRGRLRDCLARLAERERSVLVLTFYAEEPSGAIADAPRPEPGERAHGAAPGVRSPTPLRAREARRERALSLARVRRGAARLVGRASCPPGASTARGAPPLLRGVRGPRGSLVQARPGRARPGPPGRSAGDRRCPRWSSVCVARAAGSASTAWRPAEVSSARWGRTTTWCWRGCPPTCGTWRGSTSSPGSTTAPSTGFPDLPFDPSTGEVILAPSADVLRARPAHVERLRLLAVGPEGDRLLGEYTFDHTPWPGASV